MKKAKPQPKTPTEEWVINAARELCKTIGKIRKENSCYPDRAKAYEDLRYWVGVLEREREAG